MNSHAVLNWTKTNECSSLTKERQAPTKRMNFCSCCKYPLTPPPLVLQLHLNSKPQRPCWASSLSQLLSSWVCPVRPGLSQGEDDAWWCWKFAIEVGDDDDLHDCYCYSFSQVWGVLDIFSQLFVPGWRWKAAQSVVPSPWYWDTLDTRQDNVNWNNMITRWHQLWRPRLHRGSKCGDHYGRRLLCRRCTDDICRISLMKIWH